MVRNRDILGIIFVIGGFLAFLVTLLDTPQEQTGTIAKPDWSLDKMFKIGIEGSIVVIGAVLIGTGRKSNSYG